MRYPIKSAPTYKQQCDKALCEVLAGFAFLIVSAVVCAIIF